MPAAAPVTTIIPAHAEHDPITMAHKMTGVMCTSRLVAFRVTGDEIEPIYFPAIPTGELWGQVSQNGAYEFSAHGYTSRSLDGLRQAIKNKGK